MFWMKTELIFSWIAVAFYSISIILFAWHVFFKKENISRIAFIGLATAFIWHSIALGLRWYMTGHGPYTTQYEVYSSNGWVVIALFFLAAIKMPRVSLTAVVVVPLNLIFILLALAKYEAVPGLPSAFHFFWLLIHILFVKLSIAAIFIALGCSLYYLYQQRKASTRDLTNFELYNYRFTGLGFVFWTIATSAGAIWANLRWGRYWAWDPIETWSLIVWLGLGLDLHLQRFFSWHGRKAALLTVLSVSLFLLVLFIIPVLSRGIHSMYVIGGNR